MADTVFVKSCLTESITVYLTKEEKAVLIQKAKALSVPYGELLRKYLLSTSAFKIDVPSKVKAVAKGVE